MLLLFICRLLKVVLICCPFVYGGMMLSIVQNYFVRLKLILGNVAPLTCCRKRCFQDICNDFTVILLITGHTLTVKSEMTVRLNLDNYDKALIKIAYFDSCCSFWLNKFDSCHSCLDKVWQLSFLSWQSLTLVIPVLTKFDTCHSCLGKVWHLTLMLSNNIGI